MKAVGHAGTLDPMAEGLLIVLLGEATKFSKYIMGQDKHYIAQLELGIQSDTWDAEGEIEYYDSSKNIDFSKDQLESAVHHLQGPLQMPVPVFSAVKVKGKRLYDYARSGREVTTPVRTMKFYTSKLIGAKYSDFIHKNNTYKTHSVEVDLKCEKGSYIRSWVKQLGDNLECGALMSKLVRHKSGLFQLKDAVDFNDLILAESEKGEILELVKSKVLDIEFCFDGLFFRVFEKEKRLLKNGQVPHELNLRLRPYQKACQSNQNNELIRVYDSTLKELIAILEILPTGKTQIVRAFQN